MISCFTGEIVNNEILFDCFITKTEDSNAQADLSGLTPHRALLDTGATATSITRKAADRLGIIPSGWRYVHGIGGMIQCNKCIVNLTIPIHRGNNRTSQPRTSAVFNVLHVLVLDGDLFNFDVLLGMDIITQFNFQIHDGDKFTLCI